MPLPEKEIRTNLKKGKVLLVCASSRLARCSISLARMCRFGSHWLSWWLTGRYRNDCLPGANDGCLRRPEQLFDAAVVALLGKPFDDRRERYFDLVQLFDSFFCFHPIPRSLMILHAETCPQDRSASYRLKVITRGNLPR
jgi:hypothetical protein